MTTMTHVDTDQVMFRLEQAGATPLSLPPAAREAVLQRPGYGVVREAMAHSGRCDRKIRLPVPSTEKIQRMEDAFYWILMIPAERYVLRRVVAARSLINPITDRYLYQWRKLGASMGADHTAVKRWHAQGIEYIVRALISGEPQ